MTEIEKMYTGKEFNTKDNEYKKLLELSKKYCLRFTELSGLITKKKNQDKTYISIRIRDVMLLEYMILN